jgi:hypothetical protein
MIFSWIGEISKATNGVQGADPYRRAVIVRLQSMSPEPAGEQAETDDVAVNCTHRDLR